MSFWDCVLRDCVFRDRVHSGNCPDTAKNCVSNYTELAFPVPDPTISLVKPGLHEPQLQVEWSVTFFLTWSAQRRRLTTIEETKAKLLSTASGGSCKPGLTDASDDAAEAVLQQEIDGVIQPLGFFFTSFLTH